MNKLQKILGISTIGLALTSCDPIDSQIKFLEGKVVKEGGNIISAEQSAREPSYVLTVDTERGRYVIDVEEKYSKPLAALSEAIEVGDVISFQVGCGDYINNRNKSLFDIDNIGYNYSNHIRIIKKAKIEGE